MKIQITSILGSLLFEGDFSSVADAVKAAAKSYVDLRYADLSSVDLSFAKLSSADLSSANLSSADLRYADLSYADLRFADLRSADFRYADLSSADLSSVDLSYAKLSSAKLSYAKLSSADLSSAKLSSANLSSADLRSADLSSADLRSAKNADFAIAVTRILTDGDIIGWKKCCDGLLVRLLIPVDARRSSAFGRKCRAEFVRVLEVLRDGKTVTESAISCYNAKVIYTAGQIVRCDKWDEDFTAECSGGIHFFITRLEAENYIS